MSQGTSIEWTDATWNPTRGCSRVSAGCDNCYAMREARRHDHPGGSYEGLTRIGKRGVDWSGVVRLVPEALDVPLRWRNPRRIFVDSMSDLFHESLPFPTIAEVVERMCWGFFLACRKGAACPCSCTHDPESYSPDDDDCRCWMETPQHTYQVLTKRAERMCEFFAWAASDEGWSHAPTLAEGGLPRLVWLGVSVEDQATADERIPWLLRTPAAVRFVSYEPALGPADFAPWLGRAATQCCACGLKYGHDQVVGGTGCRGLDWIIVGGESGPRARPFDAEWARSTVRQCREAGVACFVKQIGARPLGLDLGSVPGTDRPIQLERLRDRKGADMSEWPEDLRVRELPRVGA